MACSSARFPASGCPASRTETDLEAEDVTCLEVGRNGRFCAGALEYQERIKALEGDLERMQAELDEARELVRRLKWAVAQLREAWA